MRTLKIGGSAAVLLLGLMGGAAVAQSPGSNKHNGATFGSDWWHNLFGGKAKADDLKSEPLPGEKTAEAAEAPVAAPRPPSAGKAADFKRFKNAFERRAEVCDKLRDVAREKNDPKMEEEAQRLYDQACEVYKQQTSRLLGAGELEEGATPATATLSGQGRTVGGAAARTASVREDKR